MSYVCILPFISFGGHTCLIVQIDHFLARACSIELPSPTIGRQFTPVTMTYGTDHDASAAGVGEVEVGALEPYHPRPDSSSARTTNKKKGKERCVEYWKHLAFVNPFLHIPMPKLVFA